MKKILTLWMAAALITVGMSAIGCKKAKAPAPKPQPKVTTQAPQQAPPAAPSAAPAPAAPAPAAPGVKPAPATPGVKPTPTVPGVKPAPIAEPPKVAGETPEKKAEPVYSYTAIREDGRPKRNPFVPFPISQAPSPIQQYEISQLGVNGVILHGQKRASVVTPACQSTFVKVDDLIGVHDGKVVDITLEGVIVRESFVDVQGRIQEYERTIPNQPYACR